MLFDFGAFTWPLLALLLLKKSKHIKKLAALLIMTIFLFGSSFLSSGIFAILHYLAPDDPLESCSASSIVVLSGGAVNELTPSISTQLRLQKALQVEKMQSLPLILSGGITEIAVPESETMASYFHLLDSTKNKTIYTERDSLNTHQNALYTKELLEKLQIEKDVILITSSYHMLRSSLVFNHLGFKVCKASAEVEPGNKWRISYKNADRTVIAFNELAGLAGYYLKGWL
jgi:uncharacterized SAM-binding protein YcdF (DUF218 family)